MRKLLTFVGTLGMLLGLLMTPLAGTVSAQDATPTTSPSFPVNIKVLNAMTAMSDIDVFINGYDKEQRVVEGLDYGTFSETITGTSPVTQVTIKRNVEFGVDQLLFDVVVPTEAGKSYVVVVSDYVLIPMQVDLSASIANTSRARLVHAASQAPAVDVLLNGTGVMSNLRYGQAGDGGVLTTPAPYDLTINQTGTSTTALATTVTLEPSKSYVYVLIGKPGSTETPLALVSDAQDQTS